MDPAWGLLSYLADWSVRAVLLLVAAAAVLAIWRPRSAAGRHAVWTAVCAGMLGVALLNVALPGLPLRVLPAGGETVAVAPVFLAELPGIPTSGTYQRTERAETSPGTADASVHATRAGVVLCVVYLVGVFISLGRLLIGYLFARRLVAASEVVDLPERGRAPVRQSNWISVPMTVGLVRPVVLLPVEWRRWPAEKLRSVLAHEWTHVRRRDWLVTLVAGWNRSLFWFHPLAWWLERRLAVLAEQACDDAALAAAGDRACYAQAVLDMAEAVRSGQGRLSWAAMAMAKPSEVGRRIDRILDESRPVAAAVGRWRWPVTVACALPLVSGAAALRLVPASGVAPAAKTAVPARVQAFVPSLTPLRRVEPAWPEAARKVESREFVELLATIDPQGKVTRVEALSGPAVLRHAAEAAVKQWSYRPVLRNGKAVYAMTQAVVNYSPPGRTVQAPVRVRTPVELDEQAEAAQRVSRLTRSLPRSSALVLGDLEQEAGGGDAKRRFFQLGRLAKAAAKAGEWEKAEAYAKELLQTAGADTKNWNYGNAIHDGNMVLGRVALHQGDVARAKQYLLQAGRTPGSPQLNSFGPNVTLAKELVEHNEREVTLEYFSLCRTFWKMDQGRLDTWSATVRGGGVPEFGANLVY